MSLKKAKNEIKKLKKDMGMESEPSLQNFFKYCEKYYGREVHCGELWFDTYKVGNAKNMIEAESNPLLFMRLSEEYYTKLHNIPNPIKEHQHGLKGILIVHWHENIYTGDDPYLNNVFDNEDYCKWFEDFWAGLKKEFDKIDLSKCPIE